MNELWKRAVEARANAMKTGKEKDFDVAWKAQGEAEKGDLQESPAQAYYPKELHGKPPAGALPEERPRRIKERKERCSMGGKKQNQGDGEATKGTKPRAKGADLVRLRLRVLHGALKKFAKVNTKEIVDEDYAKTWGWIKDEVAKAKATMDASRAPKAAAKEEAIKLPI